MIIKKKSSVKDQIAAKGNLNKLVSQVTANVICYNSYKQCKY